MIPASTSPEPEVPSPGAAPVDPAALVGRGDTGGGALERHHGIPGASLAQRPSAAGLPCSVFLVAAGQVRHLARMRVRITGWSKRNGLPRARVHRQRVEHVTVAWRTAAAALHQGAAGAFAPDHPGRPAPRRSPAVPAAPAPAARGCRPAASAARSRAPRATQRHRREADCGVAMISLPAPARRAACRPAPPRRAFRGCRQHQHAAARFPCRRRHRPRAAASRAAARRRSRKGAASFGVWARPARRLRP